MKGHLLCPKCGNQQETTIPTTKCEQFFRCDACAALVSAKYSCCVFCDYGDQPCPAAEHHKKRGAHNE